MIRSNYTYIYTILDKKINSKIFCCFSCKTIEQCTEKNSELKKQIIRYLTTKVKTKYNIFEEFKNLPKSNGKFIFENVKDLRMIFQKKIKNILEYNFFKFIKLSKNNDLFKIVLKHFAENELKSNKKKYFGFFLYINGFENIKSYLLLVYNLNKDYFDYVMQKWIALIKTKKKLDNLKVYFCVIFKISKEDEQILKLLSKTLSEIASNFSLNELCTTYDSISQLIKDEEYPEKIKEIVRNQRKAFIEKLKIPIEKKTWVNYLRIKPVSRFSKNIISKIFNEFDNAIFNINTLETRLYRSKLLNIKNLPMVEQNFFQKFQENCKDSTSNKMISIVDMENKGSIQKILFLIKLYCDTNMYEIFGKIVDTSIYNQILKKYIIESEFGTVIDELILKVEKKQLNIDEFFFIKYFNLQVMLKRFLVFKVEKVQTGIYRNIKSNELIKLENDFNQIFFNLGMKYKEINTSLDILAQIKNNKYCNMLFNQEELQNQESFLTDSWANGSLSQLNVSFGLTNQLNIKHLRTFDCWFKRKIYYLICYRRNCFQVLTKTYDLSEQEMRKLFIYTSGHKDEESFKKFCEKYSNSSGHTLTLSQFDDIFLQVNEFFDYLKRKYLSSNPIIIYPIKNNLEDLNLQESILLFDYLLFDADKKYEEVYTNNNQPIKKQNILVFKNTINKLLSFKQISQKLMILPDILLIDFDEDFKQRITNFENKFQNENISIQEALEIYDMLHPSLQEVNEEKHEFIKQVCTDPKYKGNINKTFLI